MNLKLSAHLWSSKNSLINKLLDTSAKKKKKKIIPVCAIYFGLNFVAIDVHCWIIQGLLRLELPKAEVHDWILITLPAAFALSYKGHGEVITKPSLCQLLQTASSLCFGLMVFCILWPWPPLRCRNVWVYICLKGVALLCPRSTSGRINLLCNLINICYIKRELSHWPGAHWKQKLRTCFLVPVKVKCFCKACIAHVGR